MWGRWCELLPGTLSVFLRNEQMHRRMSRTYTVRVYMRLYYQPSRHLGVRTSGTSLPSRQKDGSARCHITARFASKFPLLPRTLMTLIAAYVSFLYGERTLHPCVLVWCDRERVTLNSPAVKNVCGTADNMLIIFSQRRQQ
jgi:hypothetical protein